jgi:hypothetical protein
MSCYLATGQSYVGVVCSVGQVCLVNGITYFYVIWCDAPVSGMHYYQDYTVNSKR